MKKMNCTREKAEELASRFGMSKDVVNSFRYVDNPNLGKVLNVKYDKEEPVMDIVKEKDVEIGGIAVDRLRSLIERIERLEEEKKGIQSDVRDVFAEAKGAGFDVKIMKAVIKLRKMNAADRDEAEILLDTYCRALDM